MKQDTARFAHADAKAKLLRMASEIADFFQSYPRDQAVDSVAGHINKFWTPKMREDFLAAAAEPGQSLPPLVSAAREKIKRRKPL
jgi:formate dehydrogenase subunit delta